MLGKIEAGEGGDRGQNSWMASLTSTDKSWSKLWQAVKDREAWRAAVHGVTKSQKRLSDWTTTIPTMFYASDGRLGSTSSFRSQDIRITPLVMKIMVEMTVSVAASATLSHSESSRDPDAPREDGPLGEWQPGFKVHIVSLFPSGFCSP